MARYGLTCQVSLVFGTDCLPSYKSKGILLRWTVLEDAYIIARHRHESATPNMRPSPRSWAKS